MRRYTGVKSLLSAIVLIAHSIGVGVAQETPEAEPPVAIRGFAHQFMVQGRVHMNVCQETECVAGSRVSYVLNPPETDPDFEEFKRAQEMVAIHLRSRFPKGTTLSLGTPEQSNDGAFTVFTSFREMRSAAGQSLFTKSTIIFADNATMSVISSSMDRKAVDANSALFQVGLLVWNQGVTGQQ